VYFAFDGDIYFRGQRSVGCCCRMAPEVIACDENPDATYDHKVDTDLDYILH